jgi:hypothetical protein
MLKFRRVLANLAPIGFFCLIPAMYIMLVACNNNTSTPIVNTPDEIHYITVDSGISGGSIMPSLKKATAGTLINVTITPDEGNILSNGSLKYNDSIITGQTSADEYSFIMPDTDVIITAAFGWGYDIKTDIVENGKLIIVYKFVPNGDEVTVTVNPDEGYQLKTGSLKFNGTVIDSRINEYTYKFIMPADHVTVTAIFEPVI